MITTSRKSLFMFGPLDGQRIATSAGRYVLPTMCTGSTNDSGELHTYYEYIEYRRHVMTLGNNPVYIYLPEDKTLTEAIIHLVDTYARLVER